MSNRPPRGEAKREAAGGPAAPEGAAVLCLGPSGLPTARRLAAALPGAALHGFARRVPGAEVAFDDAMEHVAALFAAGVPVAGVAAAGILIRAVAPLLADKVGEAPLVAVAEDGSSVVPLLGGHRGANRLARACAAILGGRAAVTTAGDLRFAVALDEPPPGWRLADPSAAGAVMAAMLAGEEVALEVEAGDASWLTDAGFAFSSGGRARHSVRVTDRAGAGGLVFHPPLLALGLGCERGCDPGEALDLARRTLAAAGLAEGALACVASIDLKAGEEAVLAAARAFDVPLVLFDAARLEREAPRLATPSEAVFAAVGCHGVAEGAALAAAGQSARLAVAKTRSPRATCAIARAAGAIDARPLARPQGHLALVGLGPGAHALRTPEASRAIAAASDLVGYGPYLDLAFPLGRGKRRHPFPLGEEEERCRAALDLAAGGRRVALLCSGDPGIYAMASLVFELLDREDREAWRAVAVDVVAGVTALQVAAARAGAPLGHDFCAISLSDLLTPLEVIRRRVEAAAAADFAIAFYNPASTARRRPLAEARAILLRHRDGATPVQIARLLARAGEETVHTTLAGLDPKLVDMASIVLVGASGTRRFRHLGASVAYTPRGYRVGERP